MVPMFMLKLKYGVKDILLYTSKTVKKKKKTANMAISEQALKREILFINWFHFTKKVFTIHTF